MIISLTKVEGRGVNGGSSKIFSSSCEPPRAWARERAYGVQYYYYYYSCSP